MVVAKEKLKFCYTRVYSVVCILSFLSSCGNGKLIRSVPNDKECCNDFGSCYITFEPISRCRPTVKLLLQKLILDVFSEFKIAVAFNQHVWN